MDFLNYSLTFNALPNAITDTFVGIDVVTGLVTYKDANDTTYTVAASDITITAHPIHAPH